MRLLALIVGLTAVVAAAIAAAVVLRATERGRAVTAGVVERAEPRLREVQRTLEPGVQNAARVLRRIPIVTDDAPASAQEAAGAVIDGDSADDATGGAQQETVPTSV